MPLVKVADNWDTLSSIEKQNLLNDATENLPNIDELEKLGKFRVVIYTESENGGQVRLIAMPKVQTVLPKDMLNIKSVEDINSMSIVASVATNTNYTRALLHMDGSVNDIYGNRWTASGNINFTNDGKFGNAINFTSGRVSTTTPVNIGTEDFTIDFWQKGGTQTSALQAFFAGTIVLCNNKYITGPTIYNLPQSLIDGNWHHEALVRRDGVVYLYHDGVQIFTANDSVGVTISSIGATDNTAYSYFVGAIDEFSIVPYAKWVDTFTPPTTPYNKKINTNNEIRLAFTIDKKKYYTYETTWVEIPVEDIPTRGILYSNVQNIPTDKWKELITDNGTKVAKSLGIAYSLLQFDIENNVNIDSLTLNVNQKGVWRKSLQTSHYNVDYIDNETVVVTLNSSGSYKINYALGGW